MTHTIGVGVIGMGWMGEAHSRAYAAIPDRFHDRGIRPRLVACADAVAARADAARDRFGFETATADPVAVIANPEVEVVDICAPNGLHLELVRAALAAGKHVACEKPVGRFPDDALAAWDAARGSATQSSVGFNYRWAPLVQYAKHLIVSGEIGEITHYHGRFLNGYAGDPSGFLSWRFEADQGLGTLGDLGSHVIDMALFLAGPISRLTANREVFIKERPIPVPGTGTHYDVATGDEAKGPVTNEDYVSALVRFEDGAQGILEACRVINGARCDMSFEIHGTRGALKWNMETMNQLRFQRRAPGDPANEGYTELLSGPAHPFHGSFNPAWGLNLGYDDLKTIEAFTFLESVVTGVPREPGLREAAAAARVQESIIRSWASERWEPVTGEE